MTDLEELLSRLAGSGVTVLIKVDHERFAENGRPWTFVASGPALGEGGFVRAEESSLGACLRAGVRRLAEQDERWAWAPGLVPPG